MVKPFSTVRSPTTPLSENVSPGLSTVPSTSSAARPMLVLRYSAYGKYVVNSLTFSRMLRSRASRVVKSASSTVASTSSFRSPSGIATRSRKVVVMSSGSNVTPGLDGTTRGLPLTSFTVASTGLPLPLVAPFTSFGQPSGVDGGHQLAVVRLHGQRVGVLPRRQAHPGLVEDQGDRAGHRRVGERVQRVADVALVDLGLDIAELEVDGGVLVEVRRHDGVGGRRRVDGLADLGVSGVHARRR